MARVLHPIDVQIIEALQRSEQPLSAGDLAQLFDGEVSWRTLGYHLRRLTKLDAIELAERPTTRSLADISFRVKLTGARDD
ncbi:MAG: helix-turn-helix domain-containing protein [Solirubrobacterales bacterium]